MSNKRLYEFFPNNIVNKAPKIEADTPDETTQTTNKLETDNYTVKEKNGRLETIDNNTSGVINDVGSSHTNFNSQLIASSLLKAHNIEADVINTRPSKQTFTFDGKEVSPSQFEYLSNMDQNVSTSNNVTFGDVNAVTFIGSNANVDNIYTNGTSQVNINARAHFEQPPVFLGGEASYNAGGLDVDTQNQVRTYLTLGENGTGDDWLHLRQLSTGADYTLAFDIHDDDDFGKFKFRGVRSSQEPDDDPTDWLHIDRENLRARHRIEAIEWNDQHKVLIEEISSHTTITMQGPNASDSVFEWKFETEPGNDNDEIHVKSTSHDKTFRFDRHGTFHTSSNIHLYNGDDDQGVDRYQLRMRYYDTNAGSFYQYIVTEHSSSVLNNNRLRLYQSDKSAENTLSSGSINSITIAPEETTVNHDLSVGNIISSSGVDTDNIHIPVTFGTVYAQVTNQGFGTNVIRPFQNNDVEILSPTIGSNTNTNAGAFGYNSTDGRLEYHDGSNRYQIAHLGETGSNTFDQTLNTTDSVEFDQVNADTAALNNHILLKNGDDENASNDYYQIQLQYHDDTTPLNHFISSRHKSGLIPGNEILFHICDGTDNNSMTGGVNTPLIVRPLDVVINNDLRCQTIYTDHIRGYDNEYVTFDGLVVEEGAANDFAGGIQYNSSSQRLQIHDDNQWNDVAYVSDTGNPFDQSLNTVDRVRFEDIDINGTNAISSEIGLYMKDRSILIDNTTEPGRIIFGEDGDESYAMSINYDGPNETGGENNVSIRSHHIDFPFNGPVARFYTNGKTQFAKSLDLGHGDTGGKGEVIYQMGFRYYDKSSDPFYHFISTRHSSATKNENAIYFSLCDTTGQNSFSSGVEDNLIIRGEETDIRNSLKVNGIYDTFVYRLVFDLYNSGMSWNAAFVEEYNTVLDTMQIPDDTGQILKLKMKHPLDTTSAYPYVPINYTFHLNIIHAEHPTEAANLKWSFYYEESNQSVNIRFADPPHNIISTVGNTYIAFEMRKHDLLDSNGI
jgi:hypothetical protein